MVDIACTSLHTGLSTHTASLLCSSAVGPPLGFPSAIRSKYTHPLSPRQIDGTPSEFSP